MCGIAGIFSKNKAVKEQECRKILDSIKHRGPDGQGCYIYNNIFLGHNRLSIQDLSENGKQPMWDKDGKIGIVFNGEIYNFSEIKKELNEYEFKSKTDTEVIIYAYKKWGLKKAIDKFNGMFSFCIYDKRINKAFLVRDRIGIKPLVYYQDSENIIFASELKAILKSSIINKVINKKSLADFFVYRYVASPRTIFNNIYKLEAGHFLELNLTDFTLKNNCYWELKPIKQNYTEEEVLKRINNLIKDSIKLRLISDTPVGSFLSGGIDSSLITSLMRKEKDIEAFSIDLRPTKYSEIKFARHLAENNNIRLKSKKVEKKIFRKNFDNILSYYDEPFADSSLVPTFLLCKTVADHGYKCVLSGDGADELFYGYKWYQIFNKLYKMKYLRHLPLSTLKLIDSITNINLFSLLKSEGSEIYRKIMFDRYDIEEVNKLFNLNLELNNDYMYKEKMNNKKITSKNINYLDLKSFLVDDILYKVDIASMANSLEVRVPFLDHRLVELVFSLKLKLLYKNKDKKYLLKKIASKYIPEKNINRKKKGFSAPTAEWINQNAYNELLQGNVVKHSLISKNKMTSFLKNEKSQGKLWQMLVFEKWFSNYMT